ncbi:MAG TPA: hypothetical protein VJ831_08630, partial [Jatrophihabitantaceae bacterium]|nr:hypothetical protein [Jatrophihabitantaceae bacterium]
RQQKAGGGSTDPTPAFALSSDSAAGMPALGATRALTRRLRTHCHAVPTASRRQLFCHAQMLCVPVARPHSVARQGFMHCKHVETP